MVVGAPKMISQPASSIFPCSPLPSGIWWTPGLSIPWCCLPTSSSVCLVFSLPPTPFTVPYTMVLARPNERETWPHNYSLHLFTMVRRSSCGPIALWILARTSSLVTSQSVYNIGSILVQYQSMLAILGQYFWSWSNRGPRLAASVLIYVGRPIFCQYFWSCTFAAG